MKRLLAVVAAALLLSTIGCAKKIDAETARAWTKTEWAAAEESERIHALTQIIAADREDIDAKKSAELSIDGFNAFFETLEDASLTLGDVYDSSQVEEVEQ